MNSRLQRLCLVLSMSLLASVAAGCSPPGRSNRLASPNPRELEPGIVRSVDLLRVPGTQPMPRLNDSEVPDEVGPNLRGACGATLSQPPVSNRLVAVFLGETAALTEAIVEMEESDARELIGQIKEDIRPGCEPPTSVTADGQTQTYVQGPVIDVQGLGEDRVVTLATLEFEDGTLYVGTIVIRTGGRMIQALYSSESPVSVETVEGLAEVLHTASLELSES